MKIEVDTGVPAVSFRELSPGDVFLREGKIYVKISGNRAIDAGLSSDKGHFEPGTFNLWTFNHNDKIQQASEAELKVTF